MTNLITFGDSWTVGDELNQGEKTYGEILSAMLGYNFENLGASGASNDEIFLQLLNYCKNKKDEPCTAIIFITSPTRSLFLDYDNEYHQMFPRVDKSDGERNYYFYKYFYSIDQEKFRLEMCLNALHNLCTQYKINDYYIIGWADIDLNTPGVCKDKFFPQTCAQLFDAPKENEFGSAGSNRYIYPNACHPNQAGHQLIAESLYNWIKHAKN